MAAAGLGLLIVAAQGNPSALLGRVTGWLTGGTSVQAATGTAGLKAAAMPAASTGSKTTVHAQIAPGQSASVTGTPTITPGGKPAVAVPVATLPAWAQFWHWVQVNNPFWHTTP